MISFTKSMLYLFYIHPIFSDSYFVSRDICNITHTHHSSILRVCSEIHYCSFQPFPIRINALCCVLFFVRLSSFTSTTRLFSRPQQQLCRKQIASRTEMKTCERALGFIAYTTSSRSSKQHNTQKNI